MVEYRVSPNCRLSHPAPLALCARDPRPMPSAEGLRGFQSRSHTASQAAPNTRTGEAHGKCAYRLAGLSPFSIMSGAAKLSNGSERNQCVRVALLLVKMQAE